MKKIAMWIAVGFAASLMLTAAATILTRSRPRAGLAILFWLWHVVPFVACAAYPVIAFVRRRDSAAAVMVIVSLAVGYACRWVGIVMSYMMG